MKFISKFAAIAAKPGTSPEQIRARHAVGVEFLNQHLYARGGTWEEARRVLQCVDYDRPVVVGPLPPPPVVLVALGAAELLGPGFFSENATRFGARTPTGPFGMQQTGERRWRIAPNAPYLMWYGPPGPDAVRLGTPDEARYFIPAARESLWSLAHPDVS